MNFIPLNIPYTRSNLVITDVLTALRSLKDESQTNVFKQAFPLHAVPYKFLDEANSPAAYVTFGKETEGDNVAVQTDEMRTYPVLKIYFVLYIPTEQNANSDEVIDVQQEFQRLHAWVMARILRDPTDDNPFGIGTRYNTGNPPQLMYKFYNREGSRQQIRHEWFIPEIERLGETVPIKASEGFFASSMSLDVMVNNAP